MCVGEGKHTLSPLQIELCQVIFNYFRLSSEYSVISYSRNHFSFYANNLMSWMNLSTYLSGLSETLKIEPASELFTKCVLLGYLI